MLKDVERLATLESNVKNLTKSVDEVVGMLRSSSLQRTDQHESVITRLTVIETNLKNYQETCENERKEFSDDISELKTAHTLQRGRMMGMSAAISVVITAAGFCFEWLKK